MLWNGLNLGGLLPFTCLLTFFLFILWQVTYPTHPCLAIVGGPQWLPLCNLDISSLIMGLLISLPSGSTHVSSPILVALISFLFSKLGPWCYLWNTWDQARAWFFPLETCLAALPVSLLPIASIEHGQQPLLSGVKDLLEFSMDKFLSLVVYETLFCPNFPKSMHYSISIFRVGVYNAFLASTNFKTWLRAYNSQVWDDQLLGSLSPSHKECLGPSMIVQPYVSSPLSPEMTHQWTAWPHYAVGPHLGLAWP
jgi:hypothetical protein